MSADLGVKLLRTFRSRKTKFVEVVSFLLVLSASGVEPSGPPGLKVDFGALFASEVVVGFVREWFLKSTVLGLVFGSGVGYREDRLRELQLWNWGVLLERFVDVLEDLFVNAWELFCGLVGDLFFGRIVELSAKLPHTLSPCCFASFAC